MKTAAAVTALLCLAVCLVAPVLFFAGTLGRGVFEGVFLAASLGWFAAASLWAARSEGGDELLPS